MSSVKIKALTEIARSVLKSNYNGIRFNPMLRLAYRQANVKVSFEDDALIFEGKDHTINESNIIQIKGFMMSNKLKENIDYKIEVSK